MRQEKAIFDLIIIWRNSIKGFVFKPFYFKATSKNGRCRRHRPFFRILIHKKTNQIKMAYSAKALHRKVTSCALVQSSSEPNDPLPMPLLMPFSAAHMTALA